MDGPAPDPRDAEVPAYEPGALLEARMARRYLRLWAVSLLALLASLALLCIVADPYDVLGTPLVAGLNAAKPAAAAWPRVSKAYLIQRARPATIILGSSTADVGFNPDSAAWPATWRPVFNLGIDGGLPGTYLRFLQHALASSSPARIVLCVNFTESLVLPQPAAQPADHAQFDYEQRLRVTEAGTSNTAYWRGYMADLVFAALSFTAVQDSLDTLLHQSDPERSYETQAGWNDSGRFRRWTRQDGFHSLFVNKEHEKIPQFARWRDGARTLDLAPVAAMVRLARAHGAEVVIVIVPNHADLMEAQHQLGLDDAYDAWKRDLVRSVAAAATSGVQIWDFSGYTRFTTEALPAPGDRHTSLRWFWEPVHFQPALGDLMVRRMAGAVSPADFGVSLDTAGLPAAASSLRAGEAMWAAAHRADAGRIAASARP